MQQVPKVEDGLPVALERRDGHVHLTLSRADKMNPLDWSTIRALHNALMAISDMRDVFAVTITGAGRSFSAGGDLDGYIDLYRQPDSFTKFLADFYEVLDLIETSEKIFVALVNGACVAGGLELLLACDVVIAGSSARIGDGHLNFGQLPGAGGSQRLPRAIGLTRAKYLMLTGKLLTAEEAREIGLVNEVVPDAELLAAGDRIVASMAEKSRAGLAGAKHLANKTLTSDLASGLVYEMEYVHRYATNHPDATEGLLAFKEKRRPSYENALRA